MAKDIDWDALGRDYRANVATVRQMAEKYGISPGRVSQKAKELGWTRDLAAKIKAKAVVLGDEMDEFDRSGFVYAIYLDAPERFYKIGMAKQFSSRFDQHQCASPFSICVALCYFVPNMRAEESALHTMFSEKCVRGEWFRLNADDLSEIASRALLV